jgi:DivIVA domain-containing protein
MAAAATDSAPGERSRKFFGQVTFTPSKRGYEQVEVDAFLEQAGHAIERLLQRLREAEALAGDARTQIESAEQRAQRAELQLSNHSGDDDLIQRTLTLAERTAVAAVADAKTRAEEILQEANLEAANVFGAERSKIEHERVGLTSERQQLEALRLAVAAETHALEQVRLNLRQRVADVAKELTAVADAPDLLGYHIAAPTVPSDHQAAAPVAEVAPPPTPEVAAPDPTPALEAPSAPLPPAEVLEAAAPAAPPLPAAPASEPPVMAPSVATSIDIVIPGHQVVASPEAPPTPVVEQPTAATPEVPPGWGQPDPSGHPAAGAPMPAPAAAVAAASPAPPAAPTAPVAPPGPEASTAKSFEAQWEREATAGDPDADRAFAQFFSDKVEQDPSQTWLQEAAEAS